MTDITVLGDRVDALEESAASQESRIADLESAPAYDAAAVTALGARVATLESAPAVDLSAIEARLTAIEAELSSPT